MPDNNSSFEQCNYVGMTTPTNVVDNTPAVPKPRRCAIYARYSSDMQRESSIEDQMRKCREYAAKQGYLVLDNYIRFDQAISGATDKRPALQSLLADAEQKPKPFDVLLVDDTSRLARNLEDQQSIIKRLTFLDVSFISVSQGLDSSNESADISFAVLGLLDERFLKDLANKVRRGQEGCVLGDKYIAGGRCYGFQNVPDEDPTRIGDYGRPFVRGVKRIINPQEKPILERVFQMYDRGFSCDKIAQALRADGIPAPRPPRRNSVRGWSADGISEMLRNPIYIGQYIWKRTTSIRDPRTRRMVTRPVPEADWVRSYRPEWRIISDDLWNRVQERRASRRHIGVRKLGGLERTKRSEKYLFSGLLYCGLCGGTIRIVDTDSETARYGCSIGRAKGVCTNATRIRQDCLEHQLLAWLTCDLLRPDRIDNAANSLYARMQTKLAELQAEARKRAVNVPELRKELAERYQQAQTWTDFIITSGRQSWPTVQAQLAAAEARIREIEEILARAKEPEPLIGFTAEEIKKDLQAKLHDLQAVLTSQPLVGKQIIRKHIKKITLTPGELAGKRVYYVTVEFELGGGNSGVVLTESMDAFSQQYGFSTITVNGLTLDTSRVRRKPAPIRPQTAESSGISSASISRVADAHIPAQGDDSGQRENHA